MKHYGIADYWTLPTDGKGDCEDYALLKRHELIRLGWPSSALLMTIVKDEKGRSRRFDRPLNGGRFHPRQQGQ